MNSEQDTSSMSPGGSHELVEGEENLTPASRVKVIRAADAVVIMVSGPTVFGSPPDLLCCYDGVRVYERDLYDSRCGADLPFFGKGQAAMALQHLRQVYQSGSFGCALQASLELASELYGQLDLVFFMPDEVAIRAQRTPPCAGRKPGQAYGELNL